MTREELQRHDEYMSQPVKTLFPKPKGFSRIVNCKGCGKDFTWTPRSGVIRMYCNSDCRTKNGSSRPPYPRRDKP